MNTSKRRGIIGGLFAVAATCAAAPAATIFVPGDQPTIQDALDAAAGGDEIACIAVGIGLWSTGAGPGRHGVRRSHRHRHQT